MVVANEHVVIQFKNHTDIIYLNVVVQRFAKTTEKDAYNF